MVLHDFLSKCITPLKDRTWPAKLYTGLNDITCLEHGYRSNLESDVLAVTLSKFSTDLNSHDFVTPPKLCVPICQNQPARSLLLSKMSSFVDIDLATR
jgi:hypothetical protein